jgi:outer membrane protein assembly factor BamD
MLSSLKRAMSLLQAPFRAGVICILSATSVACASAGPDLDSSIKDNARRTYYDGMRQLLDGDYVKASTSFQAVAGSPRHVKYGALAKLRLGDAFFLQGRYAEAAEIYRGFVQQHPGDPNLPYARFRVAECQFERIPSDWFASPPAHEFDQTLTQQAEAELKGFLSTFPTSIYAAEARTMLARARQMLFTHEMYAVDFYADRGAWQAVAWRLDTIVQTYPEQSSREVLLARLVSAWVRVGQPSEIARVSSMYLDRFPQGPLAVEAKQRLEEARKSLEDSEKRPEKTPEPDSPDSPDSNDATDELPELRPPELPSLDPTLEP